MYGFRFLFNGIANQFLQVRNETAEDFLSLLKEWERLCQSYSLIGGGDPMDVVKDETENAEDDDDEEDDGDDDLGGEVFEVDKILSICFGDPKSINQRGLYLKVLHFNLISLCFF